MPSAQIDQFTEPHISFAGADASISAVLGNAIDDVAGGASWRFISSPQGSEWLHC